MNEPINDEIREMLGRAVADAPEPRPWDDIERRAQAAAEVAPVRHRTVVWLAAAACLIAIVAGFVVFIDRDDDKIRTDDDVPFVTTVPATTSTTTVQSGVASTVPAQLNRDG